MNLPDGAHLTWAVGLLVEVRSQAAATPDFQIWRAEPGTGTPLIWGSDGNLTWLYFGSQHPRAVSSETLTAEWLERLFADPSLARELPGVFGFVAHDRRLSRLLAFGDRLGIQAMHVHEDAAGTWRVSTHLTWLLLA